jgi:hypothetical protein
MKELKRFGNWIIIEVFVKNEKIIRRHLSEKQATLFVKYWEHDSRFLSSVHYVYAENEQNGSVFLREQIRGL